MLINRVLMERCENLSVVSEQNGVEGKISHRGYIFSRIWVQHHGQWFATCREYKSCFRVILLCKVQTAFAIILSFHLFRIGFGCLKPWRVSLLRSIPGLAQGGGRQSNIRAIVSIVHFQKSDECYGAVCLCEWRGLSKLNVIIDISKFDTSSPAFDLLRLPSFP
jgi:hypothetical protein